MTSMTFIGIGFALWLMHYICERIKYRKGL
jgi:hypothetical protein